MTYAALLEPIKDWLIENSLEECDIVKLFESTCMQMVSVGIPLARARLFWPTLHPLFQGETVLWQHNENASLEQFEHRDVATDEWQRSPLSFLVSNDLSTFRRRLSGPKALVDFDILKDLRDEGYTDYFLLGTRFSGTAFREQREGDARGILATFATKNEAGFSEDDIVAMQNIQRRLAVSCKTTIQSRVTRNIASTYLGKRAGQYVLDGQIRRGDGIQTRAIVWFSDMRNSTMLAESMEPEAYFDLLNAFFGATAEPVVENGGEVLDFIGDAVLGIFPFDTDEELQEAATAANKAVEQAICNTVDINSERKSAGLPEFGYGIALTKGAVMFGNIGIPSRLTFSVIGPTVNDASRIESVTKEVGHPVLASRSFANLIPDNWQSIGERTLNGSGHTTELFRYVPQKKSTSSKRKKSTSSKRKKSKSSVK